MVEEEREREGERWGWSSVERVDVTLVDVLDGDTQSVPTSKLGPSTIYRRVLLIVSSLACERRRLDLISFDSQGKKRSSRGEIEYSTSRFVVRDELKYRLRQT